MSEYNWTSYRYYIIIIIITTTTTTTIIPTTARYNQLCPEVLTKHDLWFQLLWMAESSEVVKNLYEV